jgi:alpha-mannosidase
MGDDKRHFHHADINRVIWLACALAGGCAFGQNAQWPAAAGEYRIHMIGQAHIDPVWLWPWPEGLSVIHSTFRSALDRMNETPDFAFTASSAQFYEWVAENDPAMLAEIRKRVEQGRWGLVGGWWVEPDVNIPSGESLVRQGLYGQLTYKRLLGRMAHVAYNPDSFGHPGTLPQILRLQEIEDYVFMRPMPREKTLPADVFWWRAPDGSRVLTYRIPYSYNDEGSVRARISRTLDLKEPIRTMMAFYGAGDHGGGATQENIRSIQEIKGETGAPVQLYSTPDFPEVEGDLQHHSVGCYTAEAAVKKLNRTAELALTTAEKIAAIGAAVWGAAYPKASFTAAWKRVLFLQFHDSLAGTALPEHYQTAVPQGFDYAMDIANQAMYLAAQKLAWDVPATDPDSKYLLVFNPHAWEVTANIEYDIGSAPETPLSVEDENGHPLPHQATPPSSEVNGRERLIVRMPLPAFGYRQIRIRRTQPASTAAGVHADEKTLENEHVRVTFGADGGIALFDKDAGAEVFAGGAAGARAVVLDDPSDTWSHDVRGYDKAIGAFGNAKIMVMENGPLRARVRVTTTYGASVLATDWLLYAGAPTLEARVSLDWHEHQKMMKFSFPVDITSPKPTYEIAYGHLAREANGDEEPGQRWIDLSGTRNGVEYGLAVINDAKYGYSVAGNDMRISAVRGAPYAHHIPHVLAPRPDILWQDQGSQTFRMLLMPHRGGRQEAAIQHAAEEFTAPIPVIYQGIHGGRRRQSDSFVAVDAPNIVVSAIKQAEDNDDLIFRCYETAGRAATASLDLRFAQRKWTGNFRPSEIKTLRFNVRSGAIREVNALEEEAPRE